MQSEKTKKLRTQLRASEIQDAFDANEIISFRNPDWNSGMPMQGFAVRVVKGLLEMKSAHRGWIPSADVWW